MSEGRNTELVSELRACATGKTGENPYQMLDRAAAALESTSRALSEKEGLIDRLRMEAQIHAGEARCHKSTVHEAYQACTGATGEPGNWHGAEPIRKALSEATRQRDEALAALKASEEREAALKQELASARLRPEPSDAEAIRCESCHGLATCKATWSSGSNYLCHECLAAGQAETDEVEAHEMSVFGGAWGVPERPVVTPIPVAGVRSADVIGLRARCESRRKLGIFDAETEGDGEEMANIVVPLLMLERVLGALSALENGHADLADATNDPASPDLSSLRKGAEVLTDPIAVHANMLRGTIAKPSLNNIAHLYPEVQQMKQALLATLKHFRWPTSAEHQTRDKVMAALAPFDDPPMTPGAALVSGSREERDG